jgi:AraC family transcriptional regulator of adaptative response/methylated-DNA-[protein]-cysteine methyltransferase
MPAPATGFGREGNSADCLSENGETWRDRWRSLRFEIEPFADYTRSNIMTVHAQAANARRAATGMRVAIEKSSLGMVLVAQSENGISAVLIGNDGEALRRDLAKRFPMASIGEANAVTRHFARQVIEYIESPGGELDVPVDLRGTEFQRAVWQVLRNIPAGVTVSYTDIARQLGKPTAVRAVARACAANPLAVLIPCHRVVRSDGNLSGYRWGIERKRTLLQREADRKRPTLTGH